MALLRENAAWQLCPLVYVILQQTDCSKRHASVGDTTGSWTSPSTTRFKSHPMAGTSMRKILPSYVNRTLAAKGGLLTTNAKQ